nr:putative ribonuclease H-like domain-containing protein [Tanacetum cinerariifolium]
LWKGFKRLRLSLRKSRSDKNKEGLRYSAVPPPPAQIYSPPKKDLSWTRLPEFVDDTVTDYHNGETWPNDNYTHKSMTPRAVLLKLGTTPNVVNRPNMNVAQPKITSFAKIAHSNVKRYFQRKSAVKNQPRVPRVSTVTEKIPTVDSKFPTAKSTLTTDFGDKEKAVKASARWIWRPKQNTFEQGPNCNGVSVIFKKYQYVDTQGRLKFTWTFFLRTKDETSSLLRNLITEIENLKDLKLFDIDTLTNSMNYVPMVVAGTSSTNISDISPESSSGSRLISKGVFSQKEAPSLGNALTLSNRFEDTFGDTTNAVTLNEVEADLSNMETSIPVSPTPTFRIHKDHPKSQIIDPVDTHVQTRHKSKDMEEQSFIVYQMDVKSAFLYGTIDEETLFIRKHKGEFLLVQVYVDDIIFGSSNPQLCREFEALMHDKFQISAMGELTFFLDLQVFKKKDGIFLSQDKYTIMATFTTEAKYVAAASGCGQVLWIHNQMLDYG